MKHDFILKEFLPGQPLDFFMFTFILHVKLIFLKQISKNTQEDHVPGECCFIWSTSIYCVFMMSGIEAETLYGIVSYWSLQRLCDVGIILTFHLGIWASTRLRNLSKIVS